MDTALRLIVSRGEDQLLTLETPDPILVGRQSGNDKSPPSYRTREKKCRVAIVDRDTDEVSREHLLIEALDGGRVRITNKSQRYGVQLSNLTTLRSRESLELSLPATIGVADLSLRVEIPNEENTPLRALDLAPPVPLSSVPPRNTFLAVPILEDSEKSADFYLRVAELGINKIQGAGDLKSLWEMATLCATELLQLDSAWLLHLEEREWVTKGWRSRGIVREDAGEPSRFILGKVRDEKRTFWLTAQTVGLGMLPSVIAAPLLDAQGAVMGALYGHRLGSAPAAIPFNRSLAVSMELLASAVSSAHLRLRGGASEPGTGASHADFFPPALARRVAESPQLLEDREQEIALLEFEIRDFDGIMGILGPVLAGGRLHEVIEPVSECIVENQGVLVELRDTRIRAIWNAPLQQNEFLTQAAQAALAILARVQDIGVRWTNDLGRPLEVGIALHVGTFAVGRRGSRTRFKYGPWASAWAMNEKILQVGGQLHTPLLVSKAFRNVLSQSFSGRRLGRLEAADWSEPMELFELLDPADKAFPIRARYEEALASFERGDADATSQRVAKILSDHPSDVPAYLLQMRALQAKLNKGAAATGVLKLMDAGV